MEQFQKTTPKPTPFGSRGSRTYNLSRMSTDKVPDKLVTLPPRRTPRDKYSEMNLTHSDKDHRQVPKQDNMFVQRLDHNQDVKYDHKKDHKEDKLHFMREHKLDNEPEEKPDNRHTLGQDHFEGNRYDPNRLHEEEPDNTSNPGQVLMQDNRFEGHADDHVKGRSHFKEEKQKKRELEEGNVGFENFPSNIPHIYETDENISIQTQESAESGMEGSVQGSIDDDIDNNLPSTAVLLTTPGGSKVYVVGTVHFSVESQKEVANLIRAVQPDYLVLELCSSRSYMLQWDEERILNEAQNLNFKAMRQIIRSTGFIQGGLYLLLLSVTIQITKQLGIAPGGEFRTAYAEAKNVPNCMVWFGDRPIEVTLQRMLSSLSIWQMIKLSFIVLFKEEKISKEEIERCKNKDVLERMLFRLSREMPEFSKVIMNERDAYLTYSLQVAAQKGEPNKVVGVVGIGHLAGIQENWGRVSMNHVLEILSVPPPKRSYKIIKFTLKFTAVGLVLYGVHKIASKSSFYSNIFRTLFPVLTQTYFGSVRES